MNSSRFDTCLANILMYSENTAFPYSNFFHYHSLKENNGLHCEIAKQHQIINNNLLFVQQCAASFERLKNIHTAKFTVQERLQYLPFLTSEKVINNICQDVEEANDCVMKAMSSNDLVLKEMNEKESLYAIKPGKNGICPVVSYTHRLIGLLDIERIKCMEDMKRHDMYSVRWSGGVELCPPLMVHDGCRACIDPKVPLYSRSGDEHYLRGNHFCAYHLACNHVYEEKGHRIAPGKSVRIESVEQLQQLPLWLALLRPIDRIVSNFVVPGVAENYPLLSIGDMIRFRLSACDMKNEIIGEVANVDIRSETVSVFLPPPFAHLGASWVRGHNSSMHTSPYLQALLMNETHFVDIISLLHGGSFTATKFRPFPYVIANPIEQNHAHIGRFDVRFGLFGGRGFEISHHVLSTMVNSVTSPKTLGPNNKIRKERRKKRLKHMQRIICPTILLNGIIPTLKRRLQIGISEWVHPSINSEQKTAVFDIVRRNHGNVPYIIFGPAGTGKTMTVVEAVIQVLRSDPDAKILVCAPSDAACDVLAMRILQKLPKKVHKMLRINWWSRKVASLPPSLLSCTPMSGNGVFIIPRTKEIMNASVIVCQCFVAGCLEEGNRGDTKKEWMDDHFTHLFCDETSQAMECEAMVPIFKVGNSCSIILAGDPKQLSPTIRDPIAARMGLSLSLQERLMRLPLYHRSMKVCVMTNLLGNYRSHEALLQVPSKLFYNGDLQCLAPTEVKCPFKDWGELGPANQFPLMFYNVQRGKEQSKLDTPSFYNLEECQVIVKLVHGLLKSKKVQGQGGISTGDIVIIAPFRAQVLALRVKLRLSGLGSINVGVVEDFQGQENKIVFISTVLTKIHERWNTNDAGGGVNMSEGGRRVVRLGFMHDPKRFNVAITRAHSLCVIVGHADFLETSGTYWTALIEHVRRNEGILNCGKEHDPASCDEPEEFGSSNDDTNGISKFIQRVEELKLLGPASEEDRYDLTTYYEDAPQWKVMLT